MQAMKPDNDAVVKTLRAESELRCEIAEGEAMAVKLVDGTAEIFGIEMAVNKEYTFTEGNFAIFTWYGCSLEVQSNSKSYYESDSTPMIAYVNTHIQLEAKRDYALANGTEGPRVLIVGPSDHGKSTTARILAAYAARMDRIPLFVDLDVGQGATAIPGCLMAVSVEKTNLSVEDGFTSSSPLVYFHGHKRPQENVELYKALVSTLASKVNAKLAVDVDSRASGIIVNTCGWTEGAGYEFLLHCIDVFKIDVVLVMGHDRLYASLCSLEPTVVVKLPRSGGVVQRDANTRRRQRKTRTMEYFYGKASPTSQVRPYAPSRVTLKLSNIQLLRAGALQVSEGMRLVGESESTDMAQFVKATPSAELVNSILAVLHPPEEDLEGDHRSGANASGTAAAGPGDELTRLLNTNVAGFVTVVQLSLEEDSMTVLSPCPGALPSKYLLLGSLKWVE